MNDEKFLEHFGIPGMKWGRRRGKSTTPGTTTIVRTSNSEDHDKKLTLKGKRLNEMTNAEIKTFNERLQLERTYKDLSRSELSPGKRFVNELVSKTAKEAVNQYVSKYSAKLVDELLKKTSKV